MDPRTLIDSDPRYGKILAAVLEAPYIERSALEDRLDYPQGELEQLIDTLVSEMLLLELASQADSSIESRVPKTVYLVNPEQEKAIRERI